MAKCLVGFMSISELMGVWSIVTAEVPHGEGLGCEWMGCEAGVKPFSNGVRAAIPEGVVTMVSRSCKHGEYWIVSREVRLCCPPCRNGVWD
jgi:hypothetical protein